jgi:hypothetical protein
MAVLSLLLASCPLNFPEKIQIKASPSIYLPLGEGPLGSLSGLGGLDALTNLTIPGSMGTDIYDYQGPEYGETRVVMVVMENLLPAPYDFSALQTTLSGLPAGFGSFATPLITESPAGASGIDLSGLFSSVLDDYPGLQFRSVPAYIYVDGPARLFAGGNVSINFEFYDGVTQITAGVPGPVAVSKNTLPSLSAPPGPISTLSPKPQAIDLAEILNQSPDDLKIKVGFTIGSITVTESQLPSFLAELSTDLTAHLILLLPFQFTTAASIPVFAGPTGSLPNPAMELVPGGGDLLGRTGSGDGLEDIFNNLKALGLEVTVENNLGINGHVSMLEAMPTGPSPNPNPAELGQIKLSGKSTIFIPKDKLAYPFSPALEIYLEGDFDIKRSLGGADALKMNMGAILKTDIDMIL